MRDFQQLKYLFVSKSKEHNEIVLHDFTEVYQKQVITDQFLILIQAIILSSHIRPLMSAKIRQIEGRGGSLMF